MTYTPFFVVFRDTVIALRYVESMEFPGKPIDSTFAALKDDLEINIVTCSGREYVLSTRAQYPANDFYLRRDGVIPARDAIYDKWKHILKGQ